MHISHIKIENFRSIQSLDIDFGKTTVFVGPNNAGKSAILDALRIALTRRWGQRGTGFSEYDIHLTNDASDPKTSSGVSIELITEENQSNRWSNDIVADLGDIVQTDLNSGMRSVMLRVRCMWNADTDTFDPSWEFLSANRAPLTGRGARSVNLERFWRHLPVFYLNALRDAKDEFSPRSSQFWTKLLKEMNIPSELESRALRILDLLNRKILDADPRLKEIADTLSKTTEIAARDKEGDLNLRMVPLKTWDLLSRAEIILRNEPDLAWLPLRYQGQGIQSLSVIFLFQAFVDHLLRELYETGSEPVLSLEEPETHLHPQAVRTLWQYVSDLPGQKIITTHSPYFVQNVPFRDLRLVRLTKNGTEVRSLPEKFSVSFPSLDELEAVVSNSAGLLTYDLASKSLTVNGLLDNRHYNDLIKACESDENREDLESQINDLRDISSLYIDDSVLLSLETSTRRMRGEIFFAERWLIVEGQTDYLIVHAIAHSLNYNLDQHSVAVIDAKNNGNPVWFVKLARALKIPWLAVFDGDDAGRRYRKSIARLGFSEDELKLRVQNHEKVDLETQLVADGLAPELRKVLETIGIRNANSLSDDELLSKLKNKKTEYAVEFAAQVCSNSDLAQRTPVVFRNAVKKLRGLE